jgi:hypothetical protein
MEQALVFQEWEGMKQLTRQDIDILIGCVDRELERVAETRQIAAADADESFVSRKRLEQLYTKLVHLAESGTLGTEVTFRKRSRS